MPTLAHCVNALAARKAQGGKPWRLKQYENLQERIIANTVIAPIETTFNGSPCWWWVGALAGNGRYGKMSVRSRVQTKRLRKNKVVLVRKVKYKLAHRVAREAFKGEFFRRGQYGRHVCHPHPNRTLCANPDHVEQGTPRQNNRDTVREGRHWQPNAKKAA